MNAFKEWKLVIATLFAIPITVMLFSGREVDRKVILFHDDFSQLKPQMVSGGVVGAFSEYHNISATKPVGNWIAANFRTDGSQRAWRLIEEKGKHIMYQSYEEEPKLTEYSHPILVAGDTLWKDYTVGAKFSPENKNGYSGVIFRYQTNRHYYFFGVKGDSAIIMKVHGSRAFQVVNHTILAKKKLEWVPGQILYATVNVNGNHINAAINNQVTLNADDLDFQKGKIGFMSDVPTKYHNIDIFTDDAGFKDYEKRKSSLQNEITRIRSTNPTPVVFKKIMTPGFGTQRSYRFGDLDNDGKMDILIGQVKNHGAKDKNSEVGCLTAINLDGKILWQNGTPDLWNDRLTSDVAFQIYDIDADGKNEVIYCRDMKLVVADGATGKTKYATETPVNTSSPPYDMFPKILGDAMYILNMEGTDKPKNILLKDRYENFYVYNNKLELLWSGKCKTGHYPFAWDYDNDGKDELSIGYSLYDHTGKQIFSLDKQIKDHADGTAIVKLKKNDPYVVMCAASDEGLVYYDLKGKILQHYQVGHAQNPVVCNLRDDLPGMESVTVNFWASQGTVNYVNSDMKIYKTFEPFNQGSPMSPTNWSGRTEELLTLSTDPNIGGMMDGHGRVVVPFPADGHPDMCYAVMDITGDNRDEIVTWDASEIWIYTQSDNPKQGNLYKPIRNAMYNFSNYSTAISYPPDWFDTKMSSK